MCCSRTQGCAGPWASRAGSGRKHSSAGTPSPVVPSRFTGVWSTPVGAKRSPRSGPVRDAQSSAPGTPAARAATGLRDALSGQRWFGDKHRDVTDVIPVDQAAIPGTTGLLALFDVTFADQGQERYCVPVGPPGSDQGSFV